MINSGQGVGEVEVNGGEGIATADIERSPIIYLTMAEGVDEFLVCGVVYGEVEGDDRVASSDCDQRVDGSQGVTVIGLSVNP